MATTLRYLRLARAVRTRVRALLGIAISALLLIGTAPAANAADAAVKAKTCTDYRLPVSLSAGQPANSQVFAQLCSRGKLAGKTAQVLVHGYTLNHSFWDSPYRPDLYSYVDAATAAGYTTLNLDRIGVGQSDHPSSDQVNLSTHVYILHQVIQQLRSGAVGGYTPPKVIAVGHSYGTVTSVSEASQFHDVDGVIADGFLHSADDPSVVLFGGSVWNAQSDPKFANANLPAGYVTTRPGTRAALFYTSAADPQVVLNDEGLMKDTGTATDLATFGQYFNPVAPKNVTVPVLFTVGAQDRFFCSPTLDCSSGNALVQREQPHFAPGACLKGYVQPAAGHNNVQELTAQQLFGAAIDWSNRHVGATSAPPPPGC